MSTGLDNLKHIVVLMMNGRSFDHMLGGLKKSHPDIDGLTGNESNPDTAGALVNVHPNAQFQGQLDPAPDNNFAGVDLQIFGGAPPGPGRTVNMQGFVKSYFAQSRNIERSHNVMSYFTPEKLPVLATLATEFAVFNGWFSSIPGPAICNRRFAHYGTSFGQVGMDIRLPNLEIPSIYERMLDAGHTAKIYYYDQSSGTTEIVNPNLLKHQNRVFATYDQFIADCHAGTLPDYAFVEPNFNDHTTSQGAGIASASDQNPDHHVQHGEIMIASTHNALFESPDTWKSTAMLVLYSQHGGLYDHAIPPPCTPDGYLAEPGATGTGEVFAFDRLGVRVPAVLISPWIPRGTIVPGPADRPDGRTFEHASIPASVTKCFLNDRVRRTNRERDADTFLDLLTNEMRSDDDWPTFAVK